MHVVETTGSDSGTARGPPPKICKWMVHGRGTPRAALVHAGGAPVCGFCTLMLDKARDNVLFQTMDIALTESVGFEGSNKTDDVKAVQEGLKEAARMTVDPRLDPGPIDGVCGDGTEGAIEHFQRRIGMRRPDARVDPDGRTLKRLNALLAIDGAGVTFPFARFSQFAFFGPGAGMRAFGSRRSGGARVHAGIDLYFPDLTVIRSMADGVVTRGPYPFYLRTFAIEIDHGPFVARYGELAPESVWFVEQGDEVERGRQIGRVGVLTMDGGVRLGVPSMMLHLEMYDKTEAGKLTRAAGTSARDTAGRPFFRRRDLIDPSGFVHRAALFG